MFVIVVLIHFITILATVNLQRTIKITIHPVPSSNASPNNNFNLGEVPSGNDGIQLPPDVKSYIKRLEDELLYQKLHQSQASSDLVDFGRPPPPRPLPIDDHHHDRRYPPPPPPPPPGDDFGRPPPPPPPPGDDFGRPPPPPPGDDYGRPQPRPLGIDDHYHERHYPHPPPPPQGDDFGRPPPPPGDDFGRPQRRPLSIDDHHHDRHYPPPPGNEKFVDFSRPQPRPLSNDDDDHHDRHYPPPPGNEEFVDYGRPQPRPPPPRRPPPPPPPPGDERPEARVIADDNSPPPSLRTAEFDETVRSRSLPDDKNRFNFNPTIPPSSPNKYNFNPSGGSKKRGPNPAEVYKENPFFQNISRAQNQAMANRATFSIPSQPQPAQTMTNTPDFSINFSDDIDDLPPEIDLVSKDSSQPTRPFNDVCGLSITANHLIYNGHVVPKGAYPWLVAIFYVKRTGLNYICSGSLISNKHVVTAAHCVDSKQPSDLILIFGKANIQRWIPVSGEKIVEPATIHIHPDYESLTSDADIAVIVLSEELKFTQYIRPICLWKGTSDLDNIVGHSGTVVGWGKNEQGLLMTEEPKQTNLPIVSQEKCLASNYQFHYITSNRTFCAGFRDGSGPCNGDSGGGFIMKVDGKWILRGIVSLSISETVTKSCDLANYVVFCDASKFTNWLLSFFLNKF